MKCLVSLVGAFAPTQMSSAEAARTLAKNFPPHKKQPRLPRCTPRQEHRLTAKERPPQRMPARPSQTQHADIRSPEGRRPRLPSQAGRLFSAARGHIPQSPRRHSLTSAQSATTNPAVQCRTPAMNHPIFHNLCDSWWQRETGITKKASRGLSEAADANDAPSFCDFPESVGGFHN